MGSIPPVLFNSSPPDSQPADFCDVEDGEYSKILPVDDWSQLPSDKLSKKRRRRRRRRIRLVIHEIEFVIRAVIIGMIQSLLYALVGQAVLHVVHLPGYDAYLPFSMAIGAAGGRLVLATGFIIHRNTISQERIFLRKNKLLIALDQTATFALLIHVISGVLVACACSLGVLMLRHVLPQSMDAQHAACAGMVGYLSVTSPLMVIAIVLFPWYDLHDVFLLWRKRWKDTHHPPAMATLVLRRRMQCASQKNPVLLHHDRLYR
ncbi:hypothetical protein PAXRUDRAFT_825948 [Paxillus rubicundulus Ve08.2h10]|uniref:Uncharacterized protein n=1 Tax=Paxillus rubicundulus Ve08.2h10 TaxID=930991 RepID=A0A0D0DFG1_9AGAM|nr:hypothetical protein PAXRUDRAFT_825948 [Paxillus rubicundulus Ve08.2h10]